MQTALMDEPICTAIDMPGADQNSIEYCEANLVAEAQKGCLPAFQKLVERYQTRVFRLAQRMAHSREDAEEIAQNAFLQAFKHLSHFRGQSRFYTWLVRITINEGLMKTRRRRYSEISIDDRAATEQAIYLRNLEDEEPDPEERCSQQELRSILATAIRRLPVAYRMVVELRDIEGLSTEETAEVLDLSATAVKSRLRRARIQLRQSLTQYLRPSPDRGAISVGSFLHGATQRVVRTAA